MALGDSIRALIIVSKAKGFDPTELPELGSIANFNKVPTMADQRDRIVGTLPDGIPDGWPDTHGPPPIPSVGKDEVDWNEPHQRDNVSRATKNADATPGGGWGNS